jgi:hypothetical protein
MIGQLSAVPRSGCNWVLTHRGVFACSIHSGALVPRRSTIAGVPGPRRNADDRDAGWFAPVATRRRPIFAALCAASRGARGAFPGGRPPGPPAWLPRRWRGSPLALVPVWAGVAVGLGPCVGRGRRWPWSLCGRGSPLALVPVWAGLAVGLGPCVGRLAVGLGPCVGRLAVGLALAEGGLGGGVALAVNAARCWAGLMAQVIRRVGFAVAENLWFGLAGTA